MKNNSKILFIGPKYFNYHNLIINTLQEKSFIVDFIEDNDSGLSNILSRKVSFLHRKNKQNHENVILDKLKKGDYDCLLVIGGKSLDIAFWKYLSDNYKFKKILYQWDSFKNFDYRTMIPFFDVVKTFDSQDALQLNIPYLPLFYKKEKKANIIEDLDFVFIGIWHSDRLNILNRIAEYASANQFKYYFKVYYPWYMYLYLVYVKKDIMPSAFFTFRSIPFAETISYYDRAKCIVDINHPWQSGLTMRTIETIGKGKKLLTTNLFVKNEEFFDPKMIQIIDRENIWINPDFFNLKNEYQNIEQLEISNWVNELLK